MSDAELRSGAFTLELSRDQASFDALLESAKYAASQAEIDPVGLAVIVSSSYLKIADVLIVQPLGEVQRTTALTHGTPARPFGSVFHGCDVEAFLVLLEELDEAMLRPWRTATWLSRARFELRTGRDGAGFNVLPLTDELRSRLGLGKKTLRYVDLPLSPLELSFASAVNLYVDGDLLARLHKEMSKNWAIAFSDQLAVDVLAAIALRALADPQIHDADWSTVSETLLGAVILMVEGNTAGDDAATRRQELLEMLRYQPNRFIALIEGAVEMRDATKRIVGG